MLGAGTVAVEVSPTESLSMKVDAFGARTFYGAPPPGRTQPIAAVRMGQGLWSVLSEAKAPNYSVLLTPPPGEVVGVVPVEPKTERPGLVVLDEGRRSVSVCGRRGSTQLFSLSEEIAQVVVSPYHADSVITVVTRAGSLGFHNSGQASVIMHPDTKGKS